MSSTQTVVAGRFELIDVVGRGGQGEVWRARDTRHDRTVAVKIQRDVLSGERDALLHEVRVLLDVRPHPGLPVVREDMFDGNDYVIVMDWIDGTSLDRLIQRHGAPGLALPAVLPYLRQLASCLDHLHRHEPPVIHGDVKPSNVIVRPDGGIVLVDFGISGRLDLPRRSKAGTPSYQAPELRSAGPHPAADVYGFSATAVALLTGEAPHPGPRPPVAGVTIEDDARVWDALSAGLAYDPSRRPVSCGDLAAELEPRGVGTNLPAPTTRFVGRETDLVAVTQAVRDNRLVNLVGTAGLGKTRLAVEAAARLAPAYRDGVWIAELAPVRDPSLVMRAVALVLGVDTSDARVFELNMLAELRDRNLLLVLDNCEHVLEACTALLGPVLTACPGIDVIATSRERFALDIEHTYEVQPLEIPEAEDAPPKAVALTGSVRLFLDRANGMRLTDTTTPVIARICRRLDGLPLAIELAASQTQRLTLDQVDERIEDRFSLLLDLTGSSGRHITLRAAFDWSMSMLSEEQRDLFTRLSVLPGGAGVAVACVVASPGRESADVFSDLEELVAKSLLVAAGDRYSMLESVRSFAADVLNANGETDATADRALAWAIAMCAEAGEQLEGAERVVWLERLSDELDNIRAVLVDAVDRRPQDALQVVTSTGEFWAVRGHWAEARGYLESCLATDEASPQQRADALSLSGRLAFLEADYDDSRRFAGESLRLRKQLRDEPGEARVLADLGKIAEARTDFESARDLFGESLALHRAVGDERGAADQLTNLGNVAEYSGDFELARALHEESLAIRRDIGDRQGTATTLMNLGYVMNYLGDPSGTDALKESAAAFTEVGDRYGASRAINLLAIRAWFEGDGDRAWSLGQESMRMRYEINDRLGIAVSLESIGGLASFQGHGEYAGTLFGAAERLRDVLASPVTPMDQALLTWAHSEATHAVGAEAFDAARAKGRSMRTEDAVALSLSRP